MESVNSLSPVDFEFGLIISTLVGEISKMEI
jgi:hypothetical protein